MKHEVYYVTYRLRSVGQSGRLGRLTEKRFDCLAALEHAQGYRKGLRLAHGLNLYEVSITRKPMSLR